MTKLEENKYYKKFKNIKFVVIVTCQGQPFYYFYKNLISALLGYAKHYLNKNKHGTMNFTLKQKMCLPEENLKKYGVFK